MTSELRSDRARSERAYTKMVLGGAQSGYIYGSPPRKERCHSTWPRTISYFRWCWSIILESVHVGSCSQEPTPPRLWLLSSDHSSRVLSIQPQRFMDVRSRARPATLRHVILGKLVFGQRNCYYEAQAFLYCIHNTVLHESDIFWHRKCYREVICIIRRLQ
jgi:hypothetical protein